MINDGGGRRATSGNTVVGVCGAGTGVWRRRRGEEGEGPRPDGVLGLAVRRRKRLEEGFVG